MPETTHDPDAAAQPLERDIDELDERIHRLGDHIGDAKRTVAEVPGNEDDDIDDAVGDYEDSEPDGVIGDDAEGAFDDPESEDDEDEDY
jgi:hypothetical protein